MEIEGNKRGKTWVFELGGGGADGLEEKRKGKRTIKGEINGNRRGKTWVFELGGGGADSLEEKRKGKRKIKGV
jgi:hypothetical protein